MDLKELKEWYEEELKRRDNQIDKLKEENVVLIKASLKSAEKIAKLTEKLDMLVNKK